jgi:hypothetical protein
MLGRLCPSWSAASLDDSPASLIKVATLFLNA